MFSPLFDSTKRALSMEALLPRFGGGHVAASDARLASTQELRELLSPAQLGVLFGAKGELFWLSEEITQNRTPELRRYLIQELGVAEVTPEAVITRLTKLFLEAQPDGWIVKLYEFLNGQGALRRRFEALPLVRLESGHHVPARTNGQLQAFLPSEPATDFPTVRASVCTSDAARRFLQLLGLTEPDPVDDVIRNLLPRYRGATVAVSDSQYEADLSRILAAFSTDSKGR